MLLIPTQPEQISTLGVSHSEQAAARLAAGASYASALDAVAALDAVVALDAAAAVHTAFHPHTATSTSTEREAGSGFCERVGAGRVQRGGGCVFAPRRLFTAKTQ